MGLRALVLALCVLVAACEIRIAQRTGDDVPDPACGNNILDPGEVCDDGNTTGNDGCSADCTSDEGCGNGIVDDQMEETCDDGNLLGGDGCSADCKSDETCGNGVIDEAKGETCDDGDLQGGDGCSANCQSNESCGNLITDTQTSPPEQCDGGPNGSATCDVNCTTAVCGDMTVNTLAGEQCDVGGNGNAQCDANCTTAFCGDSTVNTFRNEQCDDGNNVTTDACIACVAATCGDGFVRSGVEQCDDQNANSNDACIACKTAFCGDGFVRAGVEQCDDGNGNNGDGCETNCKFTPVVYNLNDTNIINLPSVCSPEVRYDGCSGQPTGFTWFDNAVGFSPSEIVVEFQVGVSCQVSTLSTNLNGVAGGSFTTSGLMCTCLPTPAPIVLSFGGGSYNVGGQNSVNISGALSCHGYTSLGTGVYARITVKP